MHAMQRREFLNLMLKGLGGLSATHILRPSLLMAESNANADGQNLIYINMQGGVDGLSLAPYLSGPVEQLVRTTLRPTLYVDANQAIHLHPQIGVTDKIGLHPEFKALFNQTRDVNGNLQVPVVPFDVAPKLKLIQMYGNTTRDAGGSHDECQKLLSYGLSSIPNAGLPKAWLAKLMDLNDWNSFQFWGLGNFSGNPELRAEKRPIVMDGLGGYANRRAGASDGDNILSRNAIQNILAQSNPESALALNLKNGMLTMHEAVSVITNQIIPQSVSGLLSDGESAGNVSLYDKYSLACYRDAAKVLAWKGSSASGLRQKQTVIFLQHGGLDTHSDQNLALPFVLRDIGRNLAVLIKDLANTPNGSGGTLWDKTVILLMSEFGRTNKQNASGTDHGHGSNTFILGGPVQGGVIGSAPTLTELNDFSYNRQTPTTDFRNIICDTLIEFMGFDEQAQVPSIISNYRRPSSLGLFT